MVFGHIDLTHHFTELKQANDRPASEQEKAVRKFHKEIMHRIRFLDAVAYHLHKANLISRSTKLNLEDAKNAFMALESHCQIYLMQKKKPQNFNEFIHHVENNALIEKLEKRIKLLEKHLDQEDKRLKVIIRCIHEIVHELHKAE
ncbi:hypothetical protein AYK26_05845 [Euryarchaeota archaeon SM23-78]|nr:MAG: hypothetical protein AYK26_05845 [Euryarchaeota archaeon SM23-78]MBW3001010.1 hypothetical protein [Candidatus Woesearchaeota archaeon]